MRLVVVLFLLGLASCSTTKGKKEASDLLEIEEVYYQKWVSGVQEAGSGINFYLILKKPLSSELVLEKLRFEAVEVPFIKEKETVYVAKIINPKNDLILDENPQKEYGNQIPIKSLKPNEAYLLFKMNSKVYTKYLQNVKEKPMIAYPSMNKPKN